MIPIRLTLEGIYSYQLSQTIDFTKLTIEKLFGIFGSTGSGKSTILEAMIYALYDKVERLGGTGYKYDIMNLKSKRLWIDFEFSAGERMDVYRITVESKRNSKNFNEVGTSVRKLYKKSGEDWQPIEIQKRDNVIENIIGLNYENFRRIIIIPQGKFQEFLQLGGNERSKMMMEIFKDLRKYDLFEKAALLLSLTDKAMKNVEGQLVQLSEISEEELIRLQQLLLETEKDKKLKEEELKTHSETEKLFENIKKLYSEQKDCLKKLDDLKKQEFEIRKKEQLIETYNQCMKLFNSDINMLNDIQKRSDLAHADILKIQKKLKEKYEDSEKINLEFKTYEAKYNCRNKLHEKSLKLEKLIDIKQNEEQLKTENAKKEEFVLREIKGKEYIEHVENHIVELKTERDSLKIETLPSQELHEISEWYQQYVSQLSEKENITKNINKLLSVEKEFEQTFVNKKTMFLDFNDLQVNDSQRIVDSIQTLVQKFERVNLEIQQQQLEQKLSEFADNLHDNEPCPLCGSLLHPKIRLSDAEVNNHLKLKIKEKKQLELDIEKLKLFSAWLNNELQNQITRNEEIAVLQQQLNCVETALQQHCEQFHWKNFIYSDSLIFKQQLAAEHQKHNQITLLSDNIEKESKDLTKYKTGLTEIQNGIQKFDHAITSLQAIIQTLQQDVDYELINEYQSVNTTTIKLTIVQIQNELQQIEQQYERLVSDREKINAAMNELRGSLQELEMSKNRLIEEQNKLQSILNENIEKNHFNNLAEIKAILATNLDAEKWKKKIQEFHACLASESARLEEIQQQIDGRIYIEETHMAVKDKIQQLQENLKILTENGIGYHIQIQNINEKIRTKKELEKQQVELKNRSEDLNVLKTLFNGSKFVKFVSSIYLEELCRNANERFKMMTYNQLEIRLNENTEFDVVDYLNGGHERSVKTLSGGQTFQASLSLALALIDNISRLSNSKQRFFFLDEGFGSQDKESLQTIFNTLQSLRNENKIVGIISHVEELQQNISAHVFVRNDQESGSRISGCI